MLKDVSVSVWVILLCSQHHAAGSSEELHRRTPYLGSAQRHGDRVILKQRRQHPLRLPPRRAVTGLTLWHGCQDNRPKQEPGAPWPGWDGARVQAPLPPEVAPRAWWEAVLSAWATHSHSFSGENHESSRPLHTMIIPGGLCASCEGKMKFLEDKAGGHLPGLGPGRYLKQVTWQ